MVKALFVFEIVTFLSGLFGYVVKRLNKKAMVNFKIYDVTVLAASNYNIHLPNILRIKANKAMKFGRLIKYSMINIFLEKSY